MTPQLKEYDKLVRNKTLRVEDAGFEPMEFVAPMRNFQKLAVSFALKKGRAALFEDTGLGKTRQLCEWARQVSETTGKPVLVLTRLAVCRQTVEESVNCGIPAKHIRDPKDMDGTGIYVTNYARLELLKDSGSLDLLGGIVLDESSILKNFTGKMSTRLRDWCAHIPFRLCATATPAPNDWMELGQHAEFLGVMEAPKMLATWFINDTGDTGTWRLKGHAKDDFWRWVGTWAACIFKPSDVGDDDSGYVLPSLEIKEHRFAVADSVIKMGVKDDELFDTTVVSAGNISREARKTLDERCAWIASKVTEEPNEPWCIFVETNDEADEIANKLELSGCHDWTEVRGSDKPDDKESRLWQFSKGEKRIIITKSEIAGYGLNWQHCARCIFASPDYSFEQWYQAVRRFYRFGQKREVHCYMLRGENMERVADVWRKKLDQFETMKSQMRAASKHLTGKDADGMILKDSIDCQSGDNWTLYHGDCVRVASQFADDSIAFSVFSPPFADLFTYSNDAQDMGNCDSMESFMVQFQYLIDQLHRVTMPGRLCAVHCVDLLSTKWKDGVIGYKDFSGAIVRAFMQSGWTMWSRVTIWKCPVIEMTRTKAHGLLYKTLKKDSANSRVGSAEYLLVFKKPGNNEVPITHTEADLPVSLWQELASPVWNTVDQGDVIKNIKKGTHDEKHICPLQLGVIRRALLLWSAPGDLVFSPFTGIGSEGDQSIRMGRRFVGSELKKEYFEQAVRNIKAAALDANQELFNRAS